MSHSPIEYWLEVMSHGQSHLHIKISQIAQEIAPALDLVTRQGPVNATLEIGCQDGGTLWLAIQMLELDGHAFAIDLPNGPFGGIDSKALLDTWKGWTRGKQTLDAVFENSRSSYTKDQIVAAMKSRGVEKVDFLMIDGDHTYKGVSADYESYKDLVRPGGVIALHDICKHVTNPGVEVERFWSELKARTPSDKVFEFINNPAQDWAGLGAVIV